MGSINAGVGFVDNNGICALVLFIEGKATLIPAEYIQTIIDDLTRLKPLTERKKL